MTLEEPDAADHSAIAEFTRECSDTAARAAPSKRYPNARGQPTTPLTDTKVGLAPPDLRSNVIRPQIELQHDR